MSKYFNGIVLQTEKGRHSHQSLKNKKDKLDDWLNKVGNIEFITKACGQSPSDRCKPRWMNKECSRCIISHLNILKDPLDHIHQKEM